MAELKTGSTVNGDLILNKNNFVELNQFIGGQIDFSTNINFEIDVTYEIMIHGKNLVIGQTGIIKLNNAQHMKIIFSDMYNNIDVEYSKSGYTILQYYIVDNETISIKLMETPSYWEDNIDLFESIDPSFLFIDLELDPTTMAFNNDGTKVYMYGTDNNKLYEFNLLTPWKVDSSVYANERLITGHSPNGMGFNNDGSKMYFSGIDNILYEYDLDVNYSIITAKYNGVTKNVSSENTWTQNINFNNDGSKMYIGDSNLDTIYEYDLSVNFTISSAVYNSKSKYVGSEETSLIAIVFNTDGTKMYMMGGGDRTFQYTLSTAWDITSASYDSKSLALAETNSNDLWFSADGTQMYSLGYGYRKIYQYDLSVAWDISTGALSTHKLSVGSNETTPYVMTFSYDGSKVYTGGYINETIFQYDLLVPWDISTGIYSNVSLNVTTIIGRPESIIFDPFGLKMIVLSYSHDTLFEYDLSVAWDISTGVYSGISFSISTEDDQPTSLNISSSGQTLYVLGNLNNSIYQYTLSAAWDLSSINTFGGVSDTYNIIEDSAPIGVEFNYDGSKMYVLGNNVDKLYQYTLSTPWDISTSVYDAVILSVSGTDNVPGEIARSTDGKYFYYLGTNTDSIYQYAVPVI